MHSSQINLNFLACLHMKREKISLWHHKSFIHKTYIRKLSINTCTIFVDVLFITSLYVKISFQRILLFWMYHFISFNPLVEDLDIGCALCLHRHGDYRKTYGSFLKRKPRYNFSNIVLNSKVPALGSSHHIDIPDHQH